MIFRMLSYGRDLEKEFVHATYENIAKHFSDTRYKPWPKVEAFLQALPPHSLVLDIGCGNGKYISSNPITRIGTDRTQNLLEICSSRKFAVFRADCMSLPVKTGIFDAAISIAVIHHLSTIERRVIALQDMLRILTQGGKALIYVWAKEQDEKVFNEQDVFVPWKSNKQEGEVFQRYYHVFVKGELEELIEMTRIDGWGFSILESYYDKTNWCVILEKVVKE